MQAGVILAIIFAIVGCIFALQNAQPVDLQFITLEGQASLALVILISVALGAAIMGMLNLYGRLKLGNQLKKMTKERDTVLRENETLQSNVETLRQQKLALETKPAESPETGPAVRDPNQDPGTSGFYQPL
jgi:uncharacterized integral membrane protein